MQAGSIMLPRCFPRNWSPQIRRPLWVGLNARHNTSGARFPGLHTMPITYNEFGAQQNMIFSEAAGSFLPRMFQHGCPSFLSGIQLTVDTSRRLGAEVRRAGNVFWKTDPKET